MKTIAAKTAVTRKTVATAPPLLLQFVTELQLVASQLARPHEGCVRSDERLWNNVLRISLFVRCGASRLCNAHSALGGASTFVPRKGAYRP
jgi:hypothetical protein